MAELQGGIGDDEANTDIFRTSDGLMLDGFVRRFNVATAVTLSL